MFGVSNSFPIPPELRKMPSENGIWPPSEDYPLPATYIRAPRRPTGAQGLPSNLFSKDGNLGRKIRRGEIAHPGPRVNNVSRRGRGRYSLSSQRGSASAGCGANGVGLASHHQAWTGSLPLRRKCPICCQSTGLTV